MARQGGERKGGGKFSGERGVAWTRTQEEKRGGENNYLRGLNYCLRGHVSTFQRG